MIKNHEYSDWDGNPDVYFELMTPSTVEEVYSLSSGQFRGQITVEE